MAHRKQAGAKTAVPHDHDHEREGLASLQRSEQLYRAIVESSQTLVWRCDAEGRYTFLNEAWERTLGYHRDEMLGRTFRDFQRPQRTGELVGELAGDIAGWCVTECELTQLSKDGREVHLLVNATPLRDGDGRAVGAQGTAQDVTDRKLTDGYREAAREILQILNEPGSLLESIPRVLAVLRSRTEFDAVGIRLQDGDDYPYFVHAGFPDAFVRLENTLAKRAVDGGVCRDSQGRVSLECTCGMVISGKTSPLLTPNGSFWTNDSFPLLDVPIDQDPRLNPRNRCIHHGYASVALVPIRSKGEIVGLIQLNDHRKGRFTLERVEALEGVAAQIGEALMRKQMEAALRASEQRLREYQEKLRGMAFDAAVVQERERHRIAVDLHDSIGQALALAQIKLSAVRADTTDATRVAIEEALDLLRQAIVDSRSLVFALSPPVLYDLGLTAAISWLIEELEKNHGMQIALTDESADDPLDDTTAVIVFRAVRELLMNVLEHAKSQTASVRVHRAGKHLEVVVEDTGVGFDPSAPSGSRFGLFSLREQITRLGGTVEITSSRGAGTRARVRVPAKREAPDRDETLHE